MRVPFMPTIPHGSRMSKPVAGNPKQRPCSRLQRSASANSSDADRSRNAIVDEAAVCETSRREDSTDRISKVSTSIPSRRFADIPLELIDPDPDQVRTRHEEVD